MSLGLLPPEGQSLILAGALISIALNPLVFALVEPAQRWMRARSALARRLEPRDDPLAELPMHTDATVPVAARWCWSATAASAAHRRRRWRHATSPSWWPSRTASSSSSCASAAWPRCSGDAADPAVLIQAHIARAGMLVIATPDSVDVRQMIETARTLTPASR